MKILRILVIALIPALGFVACQKSGVKPVAAPAQENSTENTTQSGSLNFRDSGNNNNGVDDNNSGINNSSFDNGGEIYGSGDDDRDGGDKKKKRN